MHGSRPARTGSEPSTRRSRAEPRRTRRQSPMTRANRPQIQLRRRTLKPAHPSRPPLPRRRAPDITRLRLSLRVSTDDMWDSRRRRSTGTAGLEIMKTIPPVLRHRVGPRSFVPRAATRMLEIPLRILVPVLVVLSLSGGQSALAVGTAATDFESFATGDVNGQNGWTSVHGSSTCPVYDVAVVANTYGYPSFG